MDIDNNKNKKDLSRGFTLIEMMVAVSIFVIVAFIVVSTLLTMSYAYKRAQKMRLIMDNFNFALQSMSIGVREGTNYSFPCSSPGSCIQFKPIEGNKICYSLKETGVDPNKKGFIEKCENTCPCNGTGSQLSSSDIDVDRLVFEKLPDIGQQKKAVKIMVGGTAGTIPREKTSFFIQTTVSQRNVDE